MKVLFVHGGWENLGVGYLSSVLRRGGHETALAFEPLLFADHALRSPLLHRLLSYRGAILARVRDWRPGLVAFSAVRADWSWMMPLARTIRERYGVPVVFGGIHATSVPEEVLASGCADYVVVGEGEGALLDLADALEVGDAHPDARNIWCLRGGELVRNPLRPLIADLDSLPFPDHEMYHRESPTFRIGYNIATSRGCPYRCAYCHNSVEKELYKGMGQPALRRRSVDNVIDELRMARARYGATFLRIVDEIFTVDLDWLGEFAERYKELGMPYWCYVHPNHVDREVVRLLRESGCRQVEIGVQSIDSTTREAVLHRRTSDRAIETAFEALDGAGMAVVADNIFGLPGQTLEELERLVLFYNEHRVSRVNVQWLQCFPGTDIARSMAAERGITERELSEREGDVWDMSIVARSASHDPELARIQTLLALAPLLPRAAVERLVRTGRYRLLPAIDANALAILLNLQSFEEMDLHKRRMLKRYVEFTLRKAASLLASDEG